jgi:hypothetical protein
MAVFAQHNVGEYYFEFDCQQWAAMDEEATADWTVIEDSCGYVEGFGSPYARGLFGASLNGKIRGALPIQVTTEGGITTVDLPDYLVPASKNTTSAIIPEGAVTSISVTDALLAGEYQDGDVFSVVDQTTGRYVRLEVTTTVGGGDLTISATGTAEFELPAGSVLVPIFSVRTGGGGGLTDGDYGDVTVSGGGTVITIDNNVVTDAKLRDSAASSVIGRAGLTAGDPADIVATTSGHVLKMTDTGLVFTTITTNSIDDGAITNAKLRDSVGLSVIGRASNTTGDPADIVAVTDGHVLRLSGTTLGFGTVATAGIADNAITDAKLRDSAGLSVIGRATNTTGDPADITAGTDAHVLRRSGTTLGFGQVATGGIADDAVTLVKLQNAVGNNIVLGNIAGAGQPYAELTQAQLQALVGGITGALTDGRVTLSSGPSTVTDNANLTYNRTTNRLTVTGTQAGTGANNAWLNLNGGALGAATEFLRASANVSAAFTGIIANASNAGASSAYWEASVGGTAAGDPFFKCTVTGGTATVFGVDNSDADKFKITPGGTAPGSTGNKGLILTTDAATKVGINIDAPTQELDVNGRTKSHTGFMGKFAQWASGNIAFGAGAGTAPTLNSVSGTDNALYVSFTTGTSPTNNGIIFTGTYPNGFTNTSWVVFSADGTNNSSTNINDFRTGGRTAAKFDFVADGTLAASTNYQFCFYIFGA